jgi:hypothetical protein
MEFINNWKEKAQHRREEEIKRLASEYITLSDFNGRLYVAFQGNPLIIINEDLSASEVLVKLQEVRDNYIDSKLKN